MLKGKKGSKNSDIFTAAQKRDLLLQDPPKPTFSSRQEKTRDAERALAAWRQERDKVARKRNASRRLAEKRGRAALEALEFLAHRMDPEWLTGVFAETEPLVSNEQKGGPKFVWPTTPLEGLLAQLVKKIGWSVFPSQKGGKGELIAERLVAAMQNGSDFWSEERNGPRRFFDIRLWQGVENYAELFTGRKRG